MAQPDAMRRFATLHYVLSLIGTIVFAVFLIMMVWTWVQGWGLHTTCHGEPEMSVSAYMLGTGVFGLGFLVSVLGITQGSER